MKIPLKKPSFYAHILSAVFLLIAFIVFYKNYNMIINLDSYSLLVLLLLSSIASGIHSQSHLSLEKEYDFNPLE